MCYLLYNILFPRVPKLFPTTANHRFWHRSSKLPNCLVFKALVREGVLGDVPLFEDPLHSQIRLDLVSCILVYAGISSVQHQSRGD